MHLFVDCPNCTGEGVVLAPEEPEPAQPGPQPAPATSYTKPERENLAVIGRRLRHLKARIAQTSGAASYDRAEVRALEWALEELVKARGPLPALGGLVDVEIEQKGPARYMLTPRSASGRRWLAEHCIGFHYLWLKGGNGAVEADAPLESIVSLMQRRRIAVHVVKKEGIAP